MTLIFLIISQCMFVCVLILLNNGKKFVVINNEKKKFVFSHISIKLKLMYLIPHYEIFYFVFPQLSEEYSEYIPFIKY